MTIGYLQIDFWLFYYLQSCIYKFVKYWWIQDNNKKDEYWYHENKIDFLSEPASINRQYADKNANKKCQAGFNYDTYSNCFGFQLFSSAKVHSAERKPYSAWYIFCSLRCRHNPEGIFEINQPTNFDNYCAPCFNENNVIDHEKDKRDKKVKQAKMDIFKRDTIPVLKQA